MKVISMIPSVTESLIEANVEVVGRTRFCIHPKQQVKNIPALGGTKSVDWNKLKVTPDLVIFDQEENTKDMAQHCPFPWVSIHVSSIDAAAKEFRRLAVMLKSDQLMAQSQRWEKILSYEPLRWDWTNIPAASASFGGESGIENLVYVIWKNPWMRVAQNTFINDMLLKLGAEKYLQVASEKYPKFEISEFDLKKTYFLFSSEPFPFGKEESLLTAGFNGSLVDGEAFSWFGIRSLRFIEAAYAK